MPLRSQAMEYRLLVGPNTQPVHVREARGTVIHLATERMLRPNREKVARHQA